MKGRIDLIHRIAAAFCAAAMFFVLGACGDLSSIMGRVSVEPVSFESDGSYELHLSFSGAEGRELRVCVYELRDGAWNSLVLESEIPVLTASGELVFSFEHMAESVAVVLRGRGGENSAVTKSGSDMPENGYSVAAVSTGLRLERGEEKAVAIQAGGAQQGAMPGPENFENPEVFSNCETVYALTIAFE